MGLRSLWGMSATHYLHEFKVILVENVSVPAGTFEAFRIEFSRSIAGMSSAFSYPKTSIISYRSYIKNHIWYSPTVKNIIRYSYVGQEGGWKKIDRDYELVAYELALAKNFEKGNEKRGQADFYKQNFFFGRER
jgi:hypothetical protein